MVDRLAHKLVAGLANQLGDLVAVNCSSDPAAAL